MAHLRFYSLKEKGENAMRKNNILFLLFLVLSLLGTFFLAEPLWAVEPQIAAGQTHTVALKSDGTLWAWGYNAHGQLGDSTTFQRNTPVQAAGGGNTWAAVAAGRLHTVALKSDGTLWAWGLNDVGQLGDGTTINKSIPVQVSGGGNTWVAIAAGGDHTVALKSDGTLWAWGYNFFGQLGDGTTTNKTTPVQVAGGGNTWVAVTAGGNHTVALKSDGTLWAWGYNLYGQLGDGTTINKSTPVQVPGGGNTWVAIAAGGAGGNHTVALKSDGTLWAWGYNFYGQLGDGTTINKTTPVQVAGGGNTWSEITAGYLHTVALKSGGPVWTWGYNQTGQLGDGTNVNKNIPFLITNIDLSDLDGDWRTDIAVYRSSVGVWYIKPSGGGAPYGMGWGGHATDKPVPGDYNGDWKTDIAVYRTGTGAWYVYPSGGSSPYGVGWGGDATDRPVTMNPSSME